METCLWEEVHPHRLQPVTVQQMSITIMSAIPKSQVPSHNQDTSYSMNTPAQFSQVVNYLEFQWSRQPFSECVLMLLVYCISVQLTFYLSVCVFTDADIHTCNTHFISHSAVIHHGTVCHRLSCRKRPIISSHGSSGGVKCVICVSSNWQPTLAEL